MRYAGDPVVVGYEAFNEPIASSEEILAAFYQRFAAGVHAIDPDAPVFFEPIALRNSFDAAPLPPAPWSNGQGVYAPHIYTTVFSAPGDSWASQDPTVLAPSMAAAAQEATAWNTPLFVGEFGIDQTLERGHRWLEAELDLQDQYLASSTIWVWRETGDWGLLDADGNVREATAVTVSRPFPRAVAGDLLAIERPAPGTLRVRYRATAESGAQPNVVSAADVHFSDFEIRCDGQVVPLTRLIGRAEFRCPGNAGEHTFELSGTPATS